MYDMVFDVSLMLIFSNALFIISTIISWYSLKDNSIFEQKEKMLFFKFCCFVKFFKVGSFMFRNFLRLPNIFIKNYLFFNYELFFVNYY